MTATKPEIFVIIQRMRLWSTPESVRNGEVSALALIETVLAMVGYVWIGVQFATWWHVWTVAIIAPFTLLRTECSVRQGWNIAEHLQEAMRALFRRTKVFIIVCAIAANAATMWFLLMGLASWWVLLYLTSSLGIFVVACLFGLPALLGRFLGAVVGLSIAPLRSIAAIPGNWWQLVGCTDFLQSPELISRPPDAGVRDFDVHVNIAAQSWSGGYNAWGAVGIARRYVSAIRNEVRNTAARELRTILIVICGACAFIPVAIPALLFRLSVKSTALIWLPLIWATKAPKPSKETWAAHLKLKTRDDLTRIVVIISILGLALVALKIVLFVAKNELATRPEGWHAWLGYQLGEFTVAFVRPGELPVWQIASTVNAVLAITLFMLLRHWLRRAEVGLGNNDATIERTVSTFYFVRRMLSTYTISNHLVVFYLLARELPLPTIGAKLFPWL